MTLDPKELAKWREQADYTYWRRHAETELVQAQRVLVLLDEVERLRRIAEPTDDEVSADLKSHGIEPAELHRNVDALLHTAKALSEYDAIVADRDACARERDVWEKRALTTDAAEQEARATLEQERDEARAEVARLKAAAVRP